MFMSNPLIGFGATYPNGNDQYTKILLNFNEINGSTVFKDEAAGATAAHAWTAAGTATNSTTQAKFGLASLACGAGAGYIETPDHADFTLGAGEWTADAWLWRAGGDGTRRFFCGQSDSGATVTERTIMMEINASNVFNAQVSDGSAMTTVTGTTTFTSTGWNHFALVRTGNILRLFANGVQEGGDIAFSGTVPNSSAKFSVGRHGEFVANPFDGFIDGFRLSVGIARWTANFTPQAIPYF